MRNILRPALALVIILFLYGLHAASQTVPTRICEGLNAENNGTQPQVPAPAGAPSSPKKGMSPAPSPADSGSKCILPTDLGPGVRGGPAPRICTAGGTLKGAESCSVECAPGFTSRGGTTEYKCGKDGQLAPATIRCSRTTCPLPSKFGQGRTWGGDDPCEEGGHLVAGKTCTIKCARGYRNSGGSALFKCGEDGSLEEADLRCEPNRCKLPPSFGPRIETGGDQACQAGKNMDAGDFCTVQCAKGFKATGGSPDYTCDASGQLSKPSLQCEAIACSIPAGFGPGVAGRGENPCVPGAVLHAGKECTIGCAPGYGVIGEIGGPGGASATRAFRCSDAGFLSAPELKCKKDMVRAYNAVWSSDFGGVRN